MLIHRINYKNRKWLVSVKKNIMNATWFKFLILSTGTRCRFIYFRDKLDSVVNDACVVGSAKARHLDINGHSIANYDINYITLINYLNHKI